MFSTICFVIEQSCTCLSSRLDQTTSSVVFCLSSKTRADRIIESNSTINVELVQLNIHTVGLTGVNSMSRVHSAKQILRQRIRQFLQSMSNEDRQRQSHRVTQYLLAHPKYLTSRSISIYVHMPTEIITRDIIRHAFESNKHVFIPRYSSTAMDMVRVYSLDDLDSLPMTKWRIRQPLLDDHTRDVADQHVDLIVVPGVAFALDGSRLGHGKGFYDRYLNTLCEHAYTIGLAFQQQIVDTDQIPMNTMDVRLKEILVSKDKDFIQ
jgi:5-formyltetrahydrofolate cyclo-ligase